MRIFCMIPLIQSSYFYCRRLEEHAFHGKSADFLFMKIFGATCMLMIAPLLDLPFLSHSLVMMVLYVWSRRNPHERLRLYGMFTVGAGYLAYILLALSVMMGGNPIVDIVGILVGHFYFFLMDIIPKEFEVKVLWTPKLL
jgi:Derlin-2/3